jgi:hypothetical protein
VPAVAAAQRLGGNFQYQNAGPILQRRNGRTQGGIATAYYQYINIA